MTKTKEAKPIFKGKEKNIQEQIKSGKHYLAVRISKNGQTFSQTINVADFPTAAAAMTEAKRIRDAALVKIANGQTVKSEKTVHDMFLKAKELSGLHLATMDRWDAFYNIGIAPKYGNVPIMQITSADIQQTINEYARAHTKRQTSGLLSVWRRIYNACYMIGLEIPDRTKIVSLPKGIDGTHRAKSISKTDFNKFCDAVLNYGQNNEHASYDQYDIWYLLQVLYFTGMRPAEALALTRDDIVLNGCPVPYIRINKAVGSSMDSRAVSGKTKTEQSVRNIPVSGQLLDILQNLMEWQKKYDSALLFADFKGQPRKIAELDTYILHVSQKCGVKLTLYMLRHQFSTDLFRSGTNPAVIRDLMGHESENMSLFYATTNDTDKINAMDGRKPS